MSNITNRTGALLVVSIVALVCTRAHAEDRPLTISKSPFSSSTYHLKKGRQPRTSTARQQTVHRSPSVGSDSERLEELGRHFVPEGKAPYVEPGRSRTARGKQRS